MNKKIISASGVIALLALPALAFAVPAQLGGNIYGLTGTLTDIVANVLWTVAVTFVIVMFVIAGFKFMTAQGDPGKVGEARNAVIWGTAGTAVIILAWSLLAIVKNQLGV